MSEPHDSLDDLVRAVAHTPEIMPFVGTERYRVRRRLGEGLSASSTKSKISSSGGTTR